MRVEQGGGGGAGVVRAVPEVTEWDEQTFRRITTTALTEAQRERVLTPPQVFPRQTEVVGVHWHPEFVPLELIRERVARTFPGRQRELIIPTQHNVLIEWDGYAGVEVDCYSAGFNRKVQLLLHFAAGKVAEATVLKAMLEHTFRYRLGQLWEFMDSVVEPGLERRVDRAAAKTGATEELVGFVRVHVEKLRRLIAAHEGTVYPEMLKNKLLRYYFDALRAHYDARLISHAQVFLQAVKEVVKREFTLTYFYRTEEIIEEVRGLGGGIVIPHPEQFWPILLADYDVDGIEVWNPQSREYTEFLIHCVTAQNRSGRNGRRGLLIFMGDDTHFGEKVLEPGDQDGEKAGRELGVQAAWDDVAIRKSLIVARADRAALIEEYRRRLD